MIMITHSLRFVAAALLLCLFGSSAFAGTGTVVLADYVSEFKEYWRGLAGKQSGVVMVAIGVGVVALLIISQIKGNKR
jgi:uncharacterized membrane protein